MEPKKEIVYITDEDIKKNPMLAMCKRKRTLWIVPTNKDGIACLDLGDRNKK